MSDATSSPDSATPYALSQRVSSLERRWTIEEHVIERCTRALFSAATRGASPREQVLAVLAAAGMQATERQTP